MKRTRETPKRGRNSTGGDDEDLGLPGRKTFPEDLFTLPSELIALTAKRRRDTSIASARQSRASSTSKAMMYTKLRNEREEFRKRLVKLIMRKDEEKTHDGSLPTPEEKEIMRYYYYIRHGIDTVHVAPVEKAWLDNIQNLIPAKLKTKHSQYTEKLMMEVKEECMLSVKKAIVDFVLKDPSDPIARVTAPETKERAEVKKLPDSLKNSFQLSKKFLLRNLHAVNPLLGQILDLWHKSYSDLRLMPDIKSTESALDLHNFKKKSSVAYCKCFEKTQL